MPSRSLEFWHEIVDSLSDALVVLSPSLEPLTVNAVAQTLIETSRPNRVHIERLLNRNPWLRRMVAACLESGQNFDNPDASLVLDRQSVAVAAEVSPLINGSSELA
ncbi:MAG: hypothetical protein ABSG46_10290, partial [Candidatus Binataceae bacterium]